MVSTHVKEKRDFIGSVLEFVSEMIGIVWGSFALQYWFKQAGPWRKDLPLEQLACKEETGQMRWTEAQGDSQSRGLRADGETSN